MREYLLFLGKDYSTETFASSEKGNDQHSAVKRREKHLPLKTSEETEAASHTDSQQIFLTPPQTSGTWDNRCLTGTVWTAAPAPTHSRPRWTGLCFFKNH